MNLKIAKHMDKVRMQATWPIVTKTAGFVLSAALVVLLMLALTGGLVLFATKHP